MWAVMERGCGSILEEADQSERGSEAERGDLQHFHIVFTIMISAGISHLHSTRCPHRHQG